jgi:hypothetical protein
MNIDAVKQEMLKEELGFFESNEDKVKRIRPYGRDSQGRSIAVDYNNLESFQGSTHIMAHDEVDGKFFAWPTLFPGYENEETQETEAWGELDAWEAFDMAMRRGELFEFDTLEEAKDFAEGSWK